MFHYHCLINLNVLIHIKLFDVGVHAIATSCPLLAPLDMSNCAYVSGEFLWEILVIYMYPSSHNAILWLNISFDI